MYDAGDHLLARQLALTAYFCAVAREFWRRFSWILLVCRQFPRAGCDLVRPHPLPTARFSFWFQVSSLLLASYCRWPQSSARRPTSVSYSSSTFEFLCFAFMHIAFARIDAYVFRGGGCFLPFACVTPQFVFVSVMPITLWYPYHYSVVCISTLSCRRWAWTLISTSFRFSSLLYTVFFFHL